MGTMNKHQQSKSIVPIVVAFIIWLLSIPINTIPICIRYLANGMTTTPLIDYILSDKEVTFIFVPICFVLLLEAGYSYQKAHPVLNALSWLILAFSTIIIILSLGWYTVCSVAPSVWIKYRTHQSNVSLFLLGSALFIGVLSHAITVIRRLRGEE